MRGHGLRRVALSNTHTHRVFVLKPPQSDNSTTANDARIHRDGFRLGTRTRDDAYFFEGGGDLRDLLDRSVRFGCFALRFADAEIGKEKPPSLANRIIRSRKRPEPIRARY